MSTPVWGTKTQGPMKNVGFVIGYGIAKLDDEGRQVYRDSFDGKPDFTDHWRLDYDPELGLHINLVLYDD